MKKIIRFSPSGFSNDANIIEYDTENQKHMKTIKELERINDEDINATLMDLTLEEANEIIHENIKAGYQGMQYPGPRTIITMDYYQKYFNNDFEE